jgi:soluble lytic murein transglycosylase-like protein
MIPESVQNVIERINEINSKFAKFNYNTQKINFQNEIEKAQAKIFAESKNMNENPDFNKFDSIISSVSNKYNIPVALIKSVIKQESNFNPQAVSPKGAKGLMQLMPETAKLLGVQDIFNPEENIEAGVKYLRMLLNKFDGDLIKALAAYNAGPDIVEKSNGIPNFNETKNYVKNVLKFIEIF